MNSLAETDYEEYKIRNYIVPNKKFYSFLFQGFFYGISVGYMSLLIPLYALKLNSNAFQVGLITGSRGMGHFLLVVPVGILLDRFGIKKIFTISNFASFLIVLMFPLVNNPKMLLLLALFEGLACSSRLTTLNAWSFELLPFLKPSQLGWYKGVSSTGSTIVGPIIGSFLSEKLGFTIAFAWIAIIILIVNLIQLFFVTGTVSKQKANEKNEVVVKSFINIFRMFKNPKILFVSYGESLNSAFTSCFRILIILLLVGVMHKSSGLVSFVTSLVGIAYLIVVFFGGFILKYLKATTIYIISSCIISMVFVVLAIADNLIFIYLASIIAGIGLGILSLVNYKTISGINSDSGKVSGIITFTTGVTLCIAPMAISCVVEMFSLKAGFLALILPFLLVTFLAAFKNKVIKGS